MTSFRPGRLTALTAASTLALVLAAAGVQAQGAAKPAAAPASAAASAPVSPAKKALVARVIKAQQPGIEALAKGLIDQPIAAIMQQVYRTLQANVPPEKREAVFRDAQADVKKFIDEVSPTMKKRAIEAAPVTMGPVLEERFSEKELEQLAVWLESPVSRKYLDLAGDMQRPLAEKVITDSRSVVEPKMRALEESLMKRLGVSDPAKAPASGAAPAPAAKKP